MERYTVLLQALGELGYVHIFGSAYSLLQITIMIAMPTNSKIRATMMKIEPPASAPTNASELKAFFDLDIVEVTGLVSEGGGGDCTCALLVMQA